jgi:hypothetical protein
VSDIKVGDLVVVVRGMPCCGSDTKSLGKTYVVSDIIEYKDNYCLNCNVWLGSGLAAMYAIGRAVANNRLKRIPPLDELERDQIVKELSI